MDYKKEIELIEKKAQLSLLYELILSDRFDEQIIFLTNKIKEYERIISEIEATR